MLIKVRDYKRIKYAEVETEGITVISGKNGNGKSTLFKAIKAAVQNQSNAQHARRGTNQFKVYMQIAKPGEEPQECMYQRSGNDVSYIGNDRKVYSKLNKQSLNDVFPNFPLRMFKFKDTRFLPNLVSQQQVPLFSQVDVYELLSEMYAPVAKLLSANMKIQQELKVADSNVLTSRASVEFTTKEQVAVNADFGKVDSEKILVEYKALQDYKNENYSLFSIQEEYNKVCLELTEFEEYGWSDLHLIEEIENCLNCVAQLGKLQQINQIDEAILKATPNGRIADVIDQQDVLKFLSLGDPIDEKQVVFEISVSEEDVKKFLSLSEEIKPAQEIIKPLPEEDVKIFYSLSSYEKIINEYTASTEQIRSMLSVVENQIKEIGICPVCNKPLAETDMCLG